jgi:glycosyltransferase involved in cell wall biosynthesis
MKMSKPTVSIGMPVYNGAKYIRQAVESLLSQSFTDFQVLVCDDGSADETVAICRQYAAQDSRVRVLVNEQRLGGAKNFNHAFELSSGKYFMWAAQDDWFHSTYIEKCLAKLENSPNAVMALSEMVMVDESGRRVSAANPIDNTNIGTEGMDVVERLHEVFRRTGWWAIYGLIRPEVLRKTKLYRSEFAGDVILIAELLLHGEFAKVEEPLFFYRVRTTQSFSIKHNMQSIDHTKQPSKTAYTDFLRGIVQCVVEFDLDPITRKKIFVNMINTLVLENKAISNNILQENIADLLALALTGDDLHRAAMYCLDRKCVDPALNETGRK